RHARKGLAFQAPSVSPGPGGRERPKGMMGDFSLARPAGHLIMGDGSGPDGLATKDGAKALSGAASVDTATTQVDKPSRTKNLITELVGISTRHTAVVQARHNDEQLFSWGTK